MRRFLQRWRARFGRGRFGRERQLGLLFGLLLCATVVVLVVWIADLWRAVRAAHSWRHLVDWHTFGTGLVLPVLQSKLFQAFVLAVGWSFWFGFKRRQLEQIRLRRSEQKYRTIINHAGEAIFLLDGEGRVLEWNKAAEKLFGEPRRNVLGRPFRDIHLWYLRALFSFYSQPRVFLPLLRAIGPLKAARIGIRALATSAVAISRSVRSKSQRL